MLLLIILYRIFKKFIISNKYEILIFTSTLLKEEFFMYFTSENSNFIILLIKFKQKSSLSNKLLNWIICKTKILRVIYLRYYFLTFLFKTIYHTILKRNRFSLEKFRDKIFEVIAELNYYIKHWIFNTVKRKSLPVLKNVSILKEAYFHLSSAIILYLIGK